MHQTKQKQLLAFLSSFVLLASAAPQDLAEIVQMSQPVPKASIERFAESIKEMQKPAEDTKRFQTIRFSPEEGILYQDDVRVGKNNGSVVVENGTVRVLSSYAATEAERAAVDETATISLDEAVEKIGCEVRTDKDGNTRVNFPFHASRVIVKSKSKPDMLNALDMSLSYDNLYVLQFATPADAYAACKKYNEMDAVEFAAPDRIVKTCATESKPLYEQGVSWGNTAIGSIEYCKELTASGDKLPEITVAVVDTGINYEHSWFENRIADGGMSFVYPDRELPQDYNGHGTHCSGIICSSTADNVKILPIAVLDDGGYGYSSDIYCGMMYAVNQGVDVVSMSFGGGGEDPMLDEAAKAMSKNGILACAAAGNESDDSRNYNVANSPDVIVVSAVDSSLEAAYFTNYGPEICLAAPGVDISSAYHIGTDKTISFDGTSMATPYVAACCANVLSAEPDLDNETVKSYLYANAIDIGDPGRDDSFGWGLVNLKDFRFSDVSCSLPKALTLPGEYEEAVDVELGCDTEGASIYYTLDGTEPTAETGILYDGKPIHLEKTTVIRAMAVLGNVKTRFAEFFYVIAGEEFEQAFVIEDGVLKEYRGVMSSLDLSEMTEIKAIGDGAFRNRPFIFEVTLPSSCQTIGDSAFKNCQELGVLHAEAVTKIGASAFSGCENLWEAKFGEVTEIGESSFRDCWWLDELTGLSKLTEIPAYAFYGANVNTDLGSVEVIHEYGLANAGIGDIIPWRNIKKIAPHGMEGTASSSVFFLDLSNAEELGEYALCGSTFTRYNLPKDLKVIPEGLLMDCMNIQHLSAPSVTEVADYGLAFCSAPGLVGINPIMETDIDFSAITSAGKFAFSGLTVDCALHFDALMNETAAVYTGIWAPQLYLPNVKTIAPTSANTEAEKQTNGIYFYSDVVYLENLERVEDYGIFYAVNLVIGDQFTEFSTKVSDFATIDYTLVGKAGSAVEKAAEELDLKFVEAPSIWMVTESGTYDCYEWVTLSAAAMSLEHTGRWSELGADGKTKVFEEEYPKLMAAEPTTRYLSYSILDKDGKVVASEAVTLTFKAGSADVETVAKDEQIVCDMRQEKKYMYIPEETGIQKIMFSNADVVISHNGLSNHFSLDWGPQSAAYEFVAGEPYIIELLPSQWITDFMDYAVFMITDESTEKTLLEEPSYFGYRGEGETYFYDSDDYSTLVVAGPEGDLKEETDYEVYASGSKEDGVLVDYIVGKNDYFGMIWHRCFIYREIEAETRRESKSDRLYCSFTPEVSGEYNVIPMFSGSEGSMEEAKNEGTWLADSVVDLWISEYKDIYETIESESSGGNISSRRCQLTAGTTYHIAVEGTGIPDCVTVSLLITSEKKSLYACDINQYFQIDETGKVDGSECMVIAQDGTELQENIDYRLEWWYDDPEYRQYVVLMVTGIGDYVGTYVEAIPTYADPASELVLGESFTVSGIQDFTLTLDTACELCLSEIKNSNGNALGKDWFSIAFIDNNLYAVVGTLKEQGDTVNLAAGEYSLTVNAENLDRYGELKEYTALVEKVRELKELTECDVDVEEVLYYTGEVCTPQLTLTTSDGKTLKEDVDYEVFAPQSIQTGEYTVDIMGIGDYAGYLQIFYYIISEPTTDTVIPLTERDNTAEITAPGQDVIYRFTADSEETVVRWDTSNPIEIILNRADGENTEVYANYGGFENYYVFATDVGFEYTLQIGFKHQYQTGDIPFSVLKSEGRDLANCSVISEPVQSSSDLKYELRYDEELLVEGKDYCVKYDGGTEGVGYAEYCFVGIGDYYGETNTFLTIYHEDMDDYGFIEQDYEYANPLTEAEEYLFPEYLNECWLYKIENNANEDATYYLNAVEESILIYWDMLFSASEEEDAFMPEDDYTDDEYVDTLYLSEFTLLVYDSDKKFIGQYGYSGVEIGANDYVYLVVVANSHESTLGMELYLSLDDAMQGGIDLEFEYVEQDGIWYGILFGSDAYIVGVEEGYQGVVLKDVITVDGEQHHVVGIDMTEETLYELCGSCLFYYEEESDWENCLLDNGLIGVPLTGVSGVVGDLNCNGIVEEWDAVILSAVISEGTGVLTTEALLEQGDTNNDGVLDLMDVMYIFSHNEAAG